MSEDCKRQRARSLHRLQSWGCNNKASLIYDLQEPYRWMVDVAIIGALQRNMFEKSDFLLTENYNIRLRPIGVGNLSKKSMLSSSRRSNSKESPGMELHDLTESWRAGRLFAGEEKDLGLFRPKAHIWRGTIRRKWEKISSICPMLNGRRWEIARDAAFIWRRVQRERSRLSCMER